MRKETLYSLQVAASQHLEADDPQTPSNQSSQTGLEAPRTPAVRGCAGDWGEEDGLGPGRLVALWQPHGAVWPLTIQWNRTPLSLLLLRTNVAGTFAGAVRRPPSPCGPLPPLFPCFRLQPPRKQNVSPEGALRLQRNHWPQHPHM